MTSHGFRYLAAVVFVLSLRGCDARAQEFRVTLHGTGDPVPSLTRFGPSILIQACDETLLFDAGRGAAQPQKYGERCTIWFLQG